MRVSSLVLFASCAILVSASGASNIGGNPITSHNKSASVKSLANDEERGLKSGYLTVKWLTLSGDKALEDFLTEAKISLTSASNIVKNEYFPALVKATKPADLMKAMAKTIKDKDLAMALYEAKKSGRISEKNADELINAHFLQPVEGKDQEEPLERAFEILMKTNDPEFPFTTSVDEIEALENYIKYLAPKKADDHDLLDRLFSTLETGAGSKAKVVSTIARHHTEPGAVRLEEKLFKHLTKPPMEKKPAHQLFKYGEMEKMGVEILNSQEELEMLERFYYFSPGLNPNYARATVKALRAGFGNDQAVALLISKAMTDPKIRGLAKGLAREYFEQMRGETTLESFEKKVFKDLGEGDLVLMRTFVKKFGKFNHGWDQWDLTMRERWREMEEAKRAKK